MFSMPELLKIKGLSVEKLIGKGSYGQVYLCRTFMGEKTYAAKVVNFGADNRLRWQAENEVEILKELGNLQNVVNIHCVLRESHRNILIIEYVSEITFLKGILYWPHFSENDAKMVMKQLLSALQYFQSRRIVHRDLRPDNILWLRNPSYYSPDNSTPQIKIIDFNLARKLSDTDNFVYVRSQGDSSYMSPECLSEPSIVTFGCDIWSVGVLLYIVFAGYPPFMDYNYDHLLLNIIEGNFAMPERFWNHVTQEGKDLLLKMLEVGHKERWSAKELLNHVWMEHTPHKVASTWPGQCRLKEYFQYLDRMKKRDNHRQFLLTSKGRKPFVPDETMISIENTISSYYKSQR